MRFKMTFAVGFAAGYVLGARAGRQRYEQIARQVRTVLGRPEVRHATDAAKRVVTDTFAGKDVTSSVGSPGEPIRV